MGKGKWSETALGQLTYLEDINLVEYPGRTSEALYDVKPCDFAVAKKYLIFRPCSNRKYGGRRGFDTLLREQDRQRRAQDNSTLREYR